MELEHPYLTHRLFLIIIDDFDDTLNRYLYTTKLLALEKAHSGFSPIALRLATLMDGYGTPARDPMKGNSSSVSDVGPTTPRRVHPRIRGQCHRKEDGSGCIPLEAWKEWCRKKPWTY